MRFKDILITDTGLYVNHRLPCLAKYRESLNVIILDPATNDIDSSIKIVDASAEKAYMDLSKTGYDSWQYQCINNHAKEIVGLFTTNAYGNTVHKDYKDVLILADLNIDVLFALDVLQDSEYCSDIHLILPIPFEKTVEGTIQHELLSKLNKVA